MAGAIDVKSYLNSLFDPNSGRTNFVGEVSPLWDNTSKLWQFNHTLTTDFIQTFWKNPSGDLKYLYNPFQPQLVSSTEKGFEPATFVDSDFTPRCIPTMVAS